MDLAGGRGRKKKEREDGTILLVVETTKRGCQENSCDSD